MLGGISGKKWKKIGIMKNCFQTEGDIMIGTFDLNFEKILIKELAEEFYESITSMADSRCLEKDFVFQEVTKELKVIAREDGIL